MSENLSKYYNSQECLRVNMTILTSAHSTKALMHLSILSPRVVVGRAKTGKLTFKTVLLDRDFEQHGVPIILLSEKIIL